MIVLRYILIVLSLGAVGLFAWVGFTQRLRGPEGLLVVLIALAFLANAAYLVLNAPEPTRLLRIVRLWMEVKEQELRRRKDARGEREP
jgi:hypothetical protein